MDQQRVHAWKMELEQAWHAVACVRGGKTGGASRLPWRAMKHAGWSAVITTHAGSIAMSDRRCCAMHHAPVSLRPPLKHPSPLNPPIPQSPPRVRDSAALGCAIVAAATAGWYEDIPEAARAMVHVERIVEPDPGRAAQYRHDGKPGEGGEGRGGV